MKWRIWIISIVITFVSVIIFGLASTQVYYNSSVNDAKKYLKVYMNEFSEEKYAFDEDGVNAFSEKLGRCKVTFMNAQGTVIADSSVENTGKNHSDREEVTKALKNGVNGEGFAVRSSTTLGKDMCYYCRNFNGEYLIRIAVFTDTDWMIFVKTLPKLLSFFAIMVELCVMMALLSANFIVSPVKKLTSEAINGDFVTTDYSELKPVAEILNERNRSIKQQLGELQDKREEAENARKSKDEFISNVTHEMNTPLTSISGYAELLNAGQLSKEQEKVAYQTIYNQSQRLKNLIACIIDYSEIDSEDLPTYEVNFSSLAKEMIYALKPEAEKRNIVIEENIAENVTILSRSERVDRVFGNLFRNAIKYNVDGGKIKVTLDEEKLVVEDSGIGISEENKSKIFSRFFTVDKSHGGKNGGFGLGLAVVKKICKKSEWDISVESSLGKGSTFSVRFK